MAYEDTNYVMVMLDGDEEENLIFEGSWDRMTPFIPCVGDTLVLAAKQYPDEIEDETEESRQNSYNDPELIRYITYRVARRVFGMSNGHVDGHGSFKRYISQRTSEVTLYVELVEESK